MKASELITLLKDADPNAEVVIPGYEGGVTSVDSVDFGNITPNPKDRTYYGEWVIYKVPQGDSMKAVMLGGKRHEGYFNKP